VEVDLVDRGAVHLGFGLGEALEGHHGALLGAVGIGRLRARAPGADGGRRGASTSTCAGRIDGAAPRASRSPSHPSSPSLLGSETSSSAGQPASTSAPRSMSPLAPEKQSK
jgi:hypothetical protein